MGDKISGFTAVVTPAETDQHEVNQGGVSKRITNAQILSLRGLMARAHNSALQIVASGATDIINFNTIDYNPGSAITTGAAWHYTVPATGWYDIRVCQPLINPDGVVWAAGDGCSIQIYKNGSFLAYLGYEESDGTAGVDHWLFPNGTFAASLTAGDTIDLRLNNFSAASRKLAGSAAIEIYRVG